MKYSFEKYCKEPEKIENYQLAKKDNFKGWHCHHRLETHNSDGERRLVDISYKELKALGMYYKRPAEELIFLPASEHNAFKKGENNPFYGKRHSEESKKRMREAKKGENNPMHGRHHTDEAKNKIAEANKGNTYGKANRGKHWFNNGKETKFCFECPPGFTTGRLLRK